MTMHAAAVGFPTQLDTLSVSRSRLLRYGRGAMSFSFGRYELDERARTLRLGGREQTLQPLVFDLLVYLVEHRERVVPKDELLGQLWNGANVTEGSLQRAVSLLRASLREGGQEQAVQTFARRGYRFCAEADPAPPDATSEESPRALAEAGKWERALEAFGALPAEASLEAEDWEAWGSAALCGGRPELAIGPFERAVAAFEGAGQRESAARVALLLCNVRLEGRELAIARGWLQRGLSYLKDEPEGKQHGLAEWLRSRLALFEGDLNECRERGRAAQDIADRIGDPDLLCLGLVYQGHIYIAQCEVRRGLVMHDEAGAMALSGRVSTWVSGLVFCSVIWAYLHLGDHHRAGQWTDQFTRWCESHGSYCYPGLCRLHRGEVLALRGSLADAEQEVRRARQQLAVAGPFVEGDACRVLGEICLSRGDTDGADRAFREAHRLGWNPQPGLALLLAARGDAEGAIKQLERALAQPTWTDGQRRGSMLAVLARVCALHGRPERARAALAELDSLPELLTGQSSVAERARARAELAWAVGDLTAAESAFRESLELWLQIQAALHAADVRLRLGELLLQVGDPTSAELELSAAATDFERVRAEPQLARCVGLRAKARGGS
ncbi:MAG: hypothetical protein EOO73_19240 [Myxococcales bacterium]|nr:MAG: hypothetical protein EOO73_19240 [Myxococcales bacterium]